MKLSRRSLLVIAALGVGAIVALGCKLSTHHGDEPASGPDPGAQAASDPPETAAASDELGPRRAHRHHRGPRHGRGGGPRHRAWPQGPGDDAPDGPREPWARGGGDGPGDEPGLRGPWDDRSGDEPGPHRGRWGHGRSSGQGDPSPSWGDDDAPGTPGPTQL